MIKGLFKTKKLYYSITKYFSVINIKINILFYKNYKLVKFKIVKLI